MIWIAIFARRRRPGSSSSRRRSDSGSDPWESTRGQQTPSGSTSTRVRYGAVTRRAMLAALGGAYLSLGFVNSFDDNMTAGRGFIALAALIFGNWRPFGAAAACLLFGFSSALVRPPPGVLDARSRTLFEALPYVLTLVAVAGVIGRSIPPAPSVARTSSSSVGSTDQAPHGASLAAGLASVATIPLAIYADTVQRQYDLLHAGFAIPVVAGLAVAALLSRGVPGVAPHHAVGASPRRRDGRPCPRHRRLVHRRRSARRARRVRAARVRRLAGVTDPSSGST